MMIEMQSLKNNILIKDVYINNVNTILVKNHEKLYCFLNILTSQNSDLLIGNTKIEKKNSIVINLLDYDSIINQLSLKKGTFLYDYLINEVDYSANINDVKEEVDKYIQDKIKEKLNTTLEYDISFNIDVSKIITNYIEFDINLSIEYFISIIKQILKSFRESNNKKIIIILVNSKIFKNTLDDLKDVYIFKFFGYSFPNIIINDQINNIDLEFIEQYVVTTFPIYINKENVKNIAINYFNQLSTNDIVIAKDYEELVVFNIINSIYNLKNKICCLLDLKMMPEIYDIFLNSL